MLLLLAIVTLRTDPWSFASNAQESGRTVLTLPHPRVVRVVTVGTELRLGRALRADVMTRTDDARYVVIRIGKVRSTNAEVSLITLT